MRKKKLVVALLLFTCTYNSIIAQTDSTQIHQEAKPEFKLSINWNSNLNYYGRTDSLRSTGFLPLAEFWITPKFYINAAPIFVNNSVQSFDYVGTVATAGFQHMTEKWITSVSVIKPFYEQSATLLQSALKAQANFSITKLSKVVNLTLGTDAKLSDKTDFGATAGLDKSFIIQRKKNGIWVIDPSVFAFAGTRQFSRTYKRQQSGLLPGTSTTTQETVKENDFAMLAYEASLPIIYINGKMMLSCTPSYVLPKNLLMDQSNSTLSEQGKNTFYATLGIKYTF